MKPLVSRHTAQSERAPGLQDDIRPAPEHRMGETLSVAPSPEPFHGGDPAPLELSKAEIRRIVNAFAAATERALTARV